MAKINQYDVLENRINKCMGYMKETKDIAYVNVNEKNEVVSINQKLLVARTSAAEEVSEALITYGKEMLKMIAQQNRKINDLDKLINKGVDDGK